MPNCFQYQTLLFGVQVYLLQCYINWYSPLNIHDTIYMIQRHNGGAKLLDGGSTKHVSWVTLSSTVNDTAMEIHILPLKEGIYIVKSHKYSFTATWVELFNL